FARSAPGLSRGAPSGLWGARSAPPTLGRGLLLRLSAAVVMASRPALHHLGERLALVGVEDRTDLLEGGDAHLRGLREQGLDLGLLGLQCLVVGAVQRQAPQLALCGAQGLVMRALRLDVAARPHLTERLQLVLAQAELLLQTAL